MMAESLEGEAELLEVIIALALALPLRLPLTPTLTLTLPGAPALPNDGLTVEEEVESEPPMALPKDVIDDAD